jgi:glutathione S-transferase
MCEYLFWSDEFEVDYATDYPAIEKWLGRIKALPGWVHPYELMPREPVAG